MKQSVTVILALVACLVRLALPTGETVHKMGDLRCVLQLG